MRQTAESTEPPLAEGNCACILCGADVPPATIAVSSGNYRHCDTCDLVFQEPAQWPDREAEYAHYQTHENSVNDPRYRKFLTQLVDPMLEMLEPGMQGLDFGAGPGPALAAMFTEAGFPTAIYDSFFAPDSTVFERQFDFIACTEVLEHLHCPARELARFDAMLKPGGLLGLMTDLRPELSSFPGWYYHRDPTHVSFYSADTIRWIARRFHWRIEMLDMRVILLRKP